MTTNRGEGVAETMRQAQRWDVIKLRHTDAGLCDRCAAHIAWGHQDHAGGWMNLRPPCERCTPIIQGFSEPTMNPLWREFERPQERKRSPAAPTTRPKALEDVYPQHSEHEMAAL